MRAIFGAAVAGVDNDRPDPTGRGEVEDRRRGSRRGRWRWSGSRSWRGRRRDEVDDDAAGAAIARQIRRPERSKPRTEVDDEARGVSRPDVLHQIGRRRSGECGVERIGLELDGEAGAFLRDCVRRRWRHVERQPRDRTDHFDVSADPRHTHVADENQPRRFPQLERGPHRSGQRARDEVNRDEPGAPVARRRRGQRNQPPADRREALAGRQHDRLRRAR